MGSQSQTKIYLLKIQILATRNAVRMQNNMNSHSLLEGMQNGTATLIFYIFIFFIGLHWLLIVARMVFSCGMCDLIP